jgi:hypothetical protein
MLRLEGAALNAVQIAEPLMKQQEIDLGRCHLERVHRFDVEELVAFTDATDADCCSRVQGR